jgi:hypothetical protein
MGDSYLYFRSICDEHSQDLSNMAFELFDEAEGGDHQDQALEEYNQGVLSVCIPAPQLTLTEMQAIFCTSTRFTLNRNGAVSC